MGTLKWHAELCKNIQFLKYFLKLGLIFVDSYFSFFAVSPSGVAGVLVPIFIVIAILGSALGYYMHRNRRLKRNFMAFASRYSPATGAAILNAVSNCKPPRTHFLSGLNS